MNKIVLIGGGGHCQVVIDAILTGNSFTIEGIIDREGKAGEIVMGVPVIGTDESLAGIFNRDVKHCLITAGSTGSPELRVRLAERASIIGFQFPTVIHPRSTLSLFSTVGGGTFIAALSVINPSARIGSHCIINTGSIIDHDVVIGDFVHVAPGSVISGGVAIGAKTHIGTGSAVIQGVSIGSNTIIGAGSTVVRNIPDNVIAYGTPCRVVRQNMVK